MSVQVFVFKISPSCSCSTWIILHLSVLHRKASVQPCWRDYRWSRHASWSGAALQKHSYPWRNGKVLLRKQLMPVLQSWHLWRPHQGVFCVCVHVYFIILGLSVYMKLSHSPISLCLYMWDFYAYGLLFIRPTLYKSQTHRIQTRVKYGNNRSSKSFLPFMCLS